MCSPHELVGLEHIQGPSIEYHFEHEKGVPDVWNEISHKGGWSEGGGMEW